VILEILNAETNSLEIELLRYEIAVRKLPFKTLTLKLEENHLKVRILRVLTLLKRFLTIPANLCSMEIEFLARTFKE
jgi:hypothetical protein